MSLILLFGGLAEVTGTGAGTLALLAGEASAAHGVAGAAAGTLTLITGEAAGEHGQDEVTGDGAGLLTAVTGEAAGSHAPPVTGAGEGLLSPITGEGAGAGGASALLPAARGSGPPLRRVKATRDKSAARNKADREELRRALEAALGLVREADPAPGVVEAITRAVGGSPRTLPAVVDWSGVLADLDEARSLLRTIQAAAEDDDEDEDVLLLAA